MKPSPNDYEECTPLGYSNVAAVYQTWPHLPHRPHRMLVFMALTALDGPSPRYWAGRCRLAASIGYTGCTGAASCPNTYQHREVSRVIADLVAAGAVERLVTGGRGRQAEYALNLWTTGVDKVPGGPVSDPREVVKHPP